MLDANQEINEFCEWARISKTTAYVEIKAGRLKVSYVGRKPIVTPENRMAWVRSLPTSRANKAA
jgi:hypothetical protein